MLRAIAICVTFLCVCRAYGQQVRLEYNNEPLNVVLLQLHEQYGVQFSYAPEMVGICEVNVDTVYPSMTHALSALVSPCSLEVKKLNKVYVIYSNAQAETIGDPASVTQEHLRATVTDYESGETLPFTTVMFNQTGLVSDVNGRLAHRLQDSSVRVQVSHVGYQNLDTIVSGAGHYMFKLKPLTTQLSAVEIQTGSLYSQPLEELSRTPGIVKLNHQVAVFQPGSSDNTLFNVLRLQPGILAAGEQTKDFIIQGSYRGQSQILFDGITLFDVSSYNDHIGAVNPLMVKDIEVHKSGFSPEIGDRLGGVVNITGTEGGKDKLHSTLRLNNQTVAGLVSIPIHKGAAVQMAFRRTYYQLYAPLNLDFLYSDILYHSFTDLNLKYSGKFRNGNSLDMSLIGFRDRNKLSYDEKDLGKDYSAFSFQENQQWGGSVRYGKFWAKAGITNITLAQSQLSTSINNSWIFTEKRINESFERKVSALNGVNESSVKLDHIIPSGKLHGVKLGLGWIQNSTKDSFSYIDRPQTVIQFGRLTGYVIDDVNLGKYWSFHPGVRWDYVPSSRKAYWQPRASVVWQVLKDLKFRGAWGVYRQFLSNDVFADGLGNFNFNWVLYDGLKGNIPLSMHKAISAQYQNEAVTISLEGFWKNVSDLGRWKLDKRTADLFLYNGIGRAYGIEYTMKRKTEKLDAWITYTWSKAEEQFRAGIPEGVYARASQDQRHEVKTAAVFYMGSFIGSLNYVYGSGFEVANARWSDRAYSRLDAALLYRRGGKKLNVETGVSVLNVLNRKNVRPNSLTFFFDQNSSIQLGTLFTPSIFLNISF